MPTLNASRSYTAINGYLDSVRANYSYAKVTYIHPNLLSAILWVPQDKVAEFIKASSSIEVDPIEFRIVPFPPDAIERVLEELDRELETAKEDPDPTLEDLASVAEYWKEKYYDLKDQTVEAPTTRNAALELQLASSIARRDSLLAILTEIRTLQSVFEAKLAQIQDKRPVTQGMALQAAIEFNKAYGGSPFVTHVGVDKDAEGSFFIDIGTDTLSPMTLPTTITGVPVKETRRRSY